MTPKKAFEKLVNLVLLWPERYRNLPPGGVVERFRERLPVEDLSSSEVSDVREEDIKDLIGKPSLFDRIRRQR